MLRKLSTLLVTLAVCTIAVAQPIVVPVEQFKTPKVNAALAAKCVPDCLVLDRKDWTELMQKVQEAIKAAVQADRTGST